MVKINTEGVCLIFILAYFTPWVIRVFYSFQHAKAL